MNGVPSIIMGVIIVAVSLPAALGAVAQERKMRLVQRIAGTVAVCAGTFCLGVGIMALNP